jgi:hypothetical protein
MATCRRIIDFLDCDPSAKAQATPARMKLHLTLKPQMLHSAIGTVVARGRSLAKDRGKIKLFPYK